MKWDQEKYEKQRAEDQAETARLKALWAKENAVDTGARREVAAKAAAEKEARETPTPEDKALCEDIFKSAHTGWNAVSHRVLGNQHFLWLSRGHPFRKYMLGLTVRIPAEKLSDKRWCLLHVQLACALEWASTLENEARGERGVADRLRTALTEHENRVLPTRVPPLPFKPEDFAGLLALTVGQEIEDMISVTVVAVDMATGELRLLVTNHGAEHKHVLGGKEYTFSILTGWDGDYNMWSLREEEDESWDGHGTGANLLLVYNEGDWSFDLDS